MKKIPRKDSLGLTKRLNMVRGQIDGIGAMLEAEEDCTKVMTQFKAARAGFDRAFALFLEENLRRCLGSKTMSARALAELEVITKELVRSS